MLIIILKIFLIAFMVSAGTFLIDFSLKNVYGKPDLQRKTISVGSSTFIVMLVYYFINWRHLTNHEFTGLGILIVFFGFVTCSFYALRFNSKQFALAFVYILIFHILLSICTGMIAGLILGILSVLDVVEGGKNQFVYSFISLVDFCIVTYAGLYLVFNEKLPGTRTSEVSNSSKTKSNRVWN